MVRALVLTAALLACGKPATMPRPPGDLDAIDGGVADAPAEATPDDTTSYGERPLPEGPTVTARLGREVSIGGVQLKLTASNHKRAAKQLGIFAFEIRRDGKRKQVELRTLERGFEAELDVLDALLVFRQLAEAEAFAVTLVAPRAPAPQSEEQCAALIDAGATTAKLSTTSSRTYTDANGVLVMLTRGWRGYCGRYTKRVWFAPPR
ncbi:MAG: hypothetical protein WKG01_18515 [Kofleriaceae bacterium]